MEKKKSIEINSLLYELNNFDKRTIIFSSLSLILNFLFILFNIIMCFIIQSPWHSCFVVYYLILTTSRFIIIFQNRYFKDFAIYKTYKSCGFLLILLAFGICSVIFQFVRGTKEYNYPIILIYVIAIYTFCSIVGAIVNFIRARKQNNLTIRLLRNINLVSVLVSYLSLQYIILETYSHNVDKTIFNMIVGIIIFAMILSIAILILLESKKIKNDE